MTPSGRLARVLAGGGFAVTAELEPPRAADTEGLRRRARELRPYVDAINLTDNPNAHVRMASWAACLAVLEEGLDPICQLQCRDRNRIALQSDLLGIAACGIENVLLLTGDRAEFGDDPEATDVFDLDSLGLIAAAAEMRDRGRLLSGVELTSVPRLFIGAVENPLAPPEARPAQRLLEKARRGAEFVQTQFVFDTTAFARFVREAEDLGALERCALIAGVGPLRSARMLDRLVTIPGVVIPEATRRRFNGLDAEGFARRGVALCAEIIGELRAMPSVRGVHVMALNWQSVIPELVETAGLTGGVGRA